MSDNQVICGDSLLIVPTLPHARMIFADPPDNTDMPYSGFKDHIDNYAHWLLEVVRVGTSCSDIFWLSYFYRYQPIVLRSVDSKDKNWHPFIWRFTFGRYQSHDCCSGYRPLLRISRPGTTWNCDSIRVPSIRQKCGDDRANPSGRVPDDVWEFPRITGNSRERRRWISNQHPEALIERMILMSTNPGDIVIDMFAGSGTVHRVCKRLNRNSISIDISQEYCDRIMDEDR